MKKVFNPLVHDSPDPRSPFQPTIWMKHWPNPAAVIVDIPKATPKVWSMASPAVIITRLSIKPKPITAMQEDMRRCIIRYKLTHPLKIANIILISTSKRTHLVWHIEWQEYSRRCFRQLHLWRGAMDADDEAIGSFLPVSLNMLSWLHYPKSSMLLGGKRVSTVDWAHRSHHRLASATDLWY